MGIKVIPEISSGVLSASKEFRSKAGQFRSLLMRWARRNGRSFPWRRTSDPFKTLVAEMMLQRTRSDQVTPVYRKFLCRYPTVSELANAATDEVREILHPLGLAFRANTFQRLALVVVEPGQDTPPIRAGQRIKA